MYRLIVHKDEAHRSLSGQGTNGQVRIGIPGVLTQPCEGVPSHQCLRQLRPSSEEKCRPGVMPGLQGVSRDAQTTLAMNMKKPENSSSP